MAAMQMEAVMLYERGLVVLSLLNAIVCSTVALWLVFTWAPKSSLARACCTGSSPLFVMGGAISGMHYTAMYAGICARPLPVGARFPRSTLHCRRW